MKKTFQLERGIAVPAGQTKRINIRLKEEYKNCVAFFLTPSVTLTDFSKMTVGLMVAEREILPLGTDATLFAVNDNNTYKEVMYDFEEDGIPAKSSTAELTITNNATSAQTLNAYFLLKN